MDGKSNTTEKTRVSVVSNFFFWGGGGSCPNNQPPTQGNNFFQFPLTADMKK